MDEISRFAKMLDEAGVKYERIIEELKVTPGFENAFGFVKCAYRRNQVLVMKGGVHYLSAICQFGSYGQEEGLIEVFDFRSEPVGFLSAEQAFKYFKKRLGRKDLQA